MRAIVIDRIIAVGKFSVRAETLVIDDDDLEFTWSITPVPVRMEPVHDPDTGRTRLEQFMTRLPVWWRITDNSGRHYTEAGGSEDGDSDVWRHRFRYVPSPPASATELLLTLREIRPYEDVAEREIETIRVPLRTA